MTRVRAEVRAAADRQVSDGVVDRERARSVATRIRRAEVSAGAVRVAHAGPRRGFDAVPGVGKPAAVPEPVRPVPGPPEQPRAVPGPRTQWPRDRPRTSPHVRRGPTTNRPARRQRHGRPPWPVAPPGPAPRRPATARRLVPAVRSTGAARHCGRGSSWPCRPCLWRANGRGPGLDAPPGGIPVGPRPEVRLSGPQIRGGPARLEGKPRQRSGTAAQRGAGRHPPHGCDHRPRGAPPVRAW